MPGLRMDIASLLSPPTWIPMFFFIDDYHHKRYEAALEQARATKMEDDFRTPLFLAAAYGQLGRADEAQPALEELRRLWPAPFSDLRRELIERHAFAPGLTDHILEGLALAEQ